MDELDLVADLNAQDDDGLDWSTLADAVAVDRVVMTATRGVAALGQADRAPTVTSLSLSPTSSPTTSPTPLQVTQDEHPPHPSDCLLIGLQADQVCHEPDTFPLDKSIGTPPRPVKNPTMKER